MSDINAGLPVDGGAPGGGPTIPPAATPVVAPVETPAGDFVPRAEFERLQRESQSRREQLQQYNELNGLDPADRSAIMDFARQYRSGNTDAAAQWLVDSARALAGDRFQQLVGQGVAPAQAQAIASAEAQAQSTEGPLTPAQVQQMLQEAFQNERQAREQESAASAARAEMSSLGFDPDGPMARALLTHAMTMGTTFQGALPSFEDQILSEAQRISARRQQVAQVAAPVPVQGGMPGYAPADLSTADARKQALRNVMASARNGATV